MLPTTELLVPGMKPALPVKPRWSQRRRELAAWAAGIVATIPVLFACEPLGHLVYTLSQGR